MVIEWTRLAKATFLTAFFVFAGTIAHRASAQDEDGFRLPAATAFCEPGHAGPLVGCTPWEGVTVYFESDDGQFSESCTTAADPNNEPPRSASCTVVVPFSSTIFASIDPAAIPGGYYLSSGESVQEWEIPDGPPTGLFGGPTFVLYPVGDSGGEEPPIDDVVEELPSTGTGSTTDASGYGSLTMALLLISLIAMSGLRKVTRFQR